MEDVVQDITIQIKGSWKFLNYIHLYKNKKKHLGHNFAFDAPTFWNDLPDEVCSAPTLACFRKNAKILSLQKTVSPYHIIYVTSQWYWTCNGYGMMIFLIGFWCCPLESALAEIKWNKSTEENRICNIYWCDNVRSTSEFRIFVLLFKRLLNVGASEFRIFCFIV